MPTTVLIAPGSRMLLVPAGCKCLACQSNTRELSVGMYTFFCHRDQCDGHVEPPPEVRREIQRMAALATTRLRIPAEQDCADACDDASVLFHCAKMYYDVCGMNPCYITSHPDFEEKDIQTIFRRKRKREE